jgi:hypothetical protein
VTRGAGRHVTRLLAAVFAVVVALTWFTASAFASTPGTAGIDEYPVCSTTPLVPGQGRQLQPEGAANGDGVTVQNLGPSAESLTLAVGPLPAGTALYGRARPVAPSWVTFGYPRQMVVLTGHSVTVGPGGYAQIPVTVTVPPGTPRGVYAGLLTVSAGGGTGGVQLGSADGTPLVFTVGEARPPWPAKTLAALGDCWAPPDRQTWWQQGSGTAYRDPPPGWHVTGDGKAWVYDPPPGWVKDHAGGGVPRQVYRGGQPAVQCASPAKYPAPHGGDEIGGPGTPVTSTAAGCAAWLAEWQAGTLPAEPQTFTAPAGQKPSTHPRVTLVTTAAARAQPNSDSAEGYGILALLGVVIAGILLYRWRHRS